MEDLLIGIGLLVSLILAIELGRWLGRLRSGREGADHEGHGPLDAAVFALVGLLVAFCFGGASGRFEARREMIINHTNSIGTAWLRLDLLPAEDRPPMRQLFRDYVDLLLWARNVSDRQGHEAMVKRHDVLAAAIWSQAMRSVQRDPRPQVATLVMPALNQMLDDTTTRLAMTRMHQPPLVMPLMAGSLLVAALLAGVNMWQESRSRWVHVLAFALVASFAVLVTHDLEYPRSGFIQLDAEDQVMIDLRRSFGEP